MQGERPSAGTRAARVQDEAGDLAHARRGPGAGTEPAGEAEDPKTGRRPQAAPTTTKQSRQGRRRLEGHVPDDEMSQDGLSRAHGCTIAGRLTGASPCSPSGSKRLRAHASAMTHSRLPAAPHSGGARGSSMP
jgi:hypothetical protein